MQTGRESVERAHDAMEAGRWHLFAMAAVCLLAGAIYAGSLNAPFVFDDEYNLLRNSSVRIDSLTLDSLSEAAFEGPARSRPLTGLTFALNYYFGAYEVLGYHLVNLAIHTFNGILVYFLSLTILENLLQPKRAASGAVPARRMALCSALIFVAHPIQTQAVTYVSQRYTSMAAMFCFMALLCYIGSRSAGSRRQAAGGRQEAAAGMRDGRRAFMATCLMALSLLSAVLAMMCKQNAAMLPGVVALTEFLLFDRSWKGWKKKLLWGAPVVSLVWLLVLHVIGPIPVAGAPAGLLEAVSERLTETSRVGRWQYLCTQFNVIAMYVRLLFLPLHQNLDYLYPFKSGFWEDFTPLAFLFLLAVAGAGLMLRKRHPVVTFAVGWFFVTLAVESSVFPIRDAMVEHRLYLPAFAFGLSVPYAIYTTLGRRRPAADSLMLVMVALLAAATCLRNQTWKDPVSLWADVVAKSPLNYRAYANLGLALHMAGRPDESLANYRKALVFRPADPKLEVNMAAALIRGGEVDDALAVLQKVLARHPEHAAARFQIGVALEKKGRYGEAETQFARCLARLADDAQVNYHYAYVLSREGRLDLAAAHFTKVLALDPDNEDARYSLAAVAFRQGRLEASHRLFEALMRREPSQVDVHLNLAHIDRHRGRCAEAIRHCLAALRLAPEHVDARRQLAAPCGGLPDAVAEE